MKFQPSIATYAIVIAMAFMVGYALTAMRILP